MCIRDSIQTYGENSLKAHPNGQVELFYDGSKKLETTSVGTRLYGRTDIGDSTGGSTDDRLAFGDSQDLQIYHDSNHSRIVDSGTGGLKIQSDALAIDNAAGTETMAAFTQDGSVQLRYNNSTKFETTSTGATITGSLLTTGNLNPSGYIKVLDGSDGIYVGTGNDLQIYHNGTHSFILNTTGVLKLGDDSEIVLGKQSADVNYIKAYGGGAVELYYDNSKKLETASRGMIVHGGSADWSETNPGTTTGSIHLDPNDGSNHYGSAITFGASDQNNGTDAQAGIYTRSDGSYGTKMYFATTGSYSNGSYARFYINESGHVLQTVYNDYV